MQAYGTWRFLPESEQCSVKDMEAFVSQAKRVLSGKKIECMVEGRLWEACSPLRCCGFDHLPTFRAVGIVILFTEVTARSEYRALRYSPQRHTIWVIEDRDWKVVVTCDFRVAFRCLLLRRSSKSTLSFASF